jgi:simple sugar transport system ATP-binding protein
LLEARARGAAILLISEDLDEILGLSDEVLVMFKGRLSSPSQRGERSIRDLGALMAGQGLEEAA